MYEINGYAVLEVLHDDLENQHVIIKTYHGMYQKIKANCPKTKLVLNEQANIVFTWQKFDLNAETWLDDPTNSEPIKLDIDGKKIELQPENGTDTLIFSSAEPGPVTIKTENPGVDNAYLEVQVNA